MPAEEAAVFDRQVPNILAMISSEPETWNDVLNRFVDVAANVCDGFRRGEIKALEQNQAMRDEAEKAFSQRSKDDGYPEDMRAALEDAIRKHGRMNSDKARAQLGDKVYEAIKRLGHGCGWMWLCEQPALALEDIARKIDRVLGRSAMPPRPYKDRQGGGQYWRNHTPEHRRAVAPDKIAEVLLPQVSMHNYYLPIEALKELRLTTMDWNNLLGRIIKKAQAGFVQPHAFGAYFLAAAQRWEADHPIKKEHDPDADVNAQTNSTYYAARKTKH